MDKDNQFYGQQEGERVLLKVKSHRLVHELKLLKAVLAGMVLAMLCWIVSSATEAATIIRLVGMIAGLIVSVIGWWTVTVLDKKSASYITDRRVVRFTATTPWTVNSRSISWDEVVKVKTKSMGVLWRLLGVGAVVVHARSTVISLEEAHDQVATDDDIQLSGVEYYQDLGNYLDKVLYTFKKEPEKMGELREFVLKPKGKRY